MKAPAELLRQAEAEIERAEKLLEIAIIARRMSVSGETVRRLIKSGKLVAYKLDGVWRIQERDYQSFLAARRFTPANSLHTSRS